VQLQNILGTCLLHSRNALLLVLQTFVGLGNLSIWGCGSQADAPALLEVLRNLDFVDGLPLLEAGADGDGAVVHGAARDELYDKAGFSALLGCASLQASA
jgi:hypothetical protein